MKKSKKTWEKVDYSSKDFDFLTKLIQKCKKERGKEKKKYTFEKTKIKNWKSKHINEWVNFIGFPGLNGKFEHGKDVINVLLNNEAFHQFSECELKYFSSIHIFLLHNSEGYYSRGFQKVLEKIILAMDAEGFLLKSYHEISNLALVLSDKEHLRKLYFDKDQKIPKRFRVTVVVTENLFSYKDRLFRMTISPIQDMVARRTFGLFHSSVVVGPWYFSWSDIEVIVPKRIGTKNAFLAFDCTPGEWAINKLSLEEIKEKLCETLIKWNCAYSYAMKSKEGTYGNCQDFVIDLCKNLGVDIHKTLNTGAFAHFMNKIRKYGTFKMEFNPSEEFIDYYKFEHNKDLQKFNNGKGRYKIVFESHKELDRLWRYCQETDPFQDPSLDTEVQLLKAFDRAFWLRHLKDRKNPMYQPLELSDIQNLEEIEQHKKHNRGKCLCGFGDPTITKTFLMM